MVKPLFDTNVLIDYLAGREPARLEIERYGERCISVIGWMEVMVGAPSESEDAIRRFLDSFERIGVDPLVAERAVSLRRAHRLKLPDAIVWATAQVHNFLLVTRDFRDFPPDDPGIRMPYRL